MGASPGKALSCFFADVRHCLRPEFLANSGQASSKHLILLSVTCNADRTRGLQSHKPPIRMSKRTCTVVLDVSFLLLPVSDREQAPSPSLRHYMGLGVTKIVRTSFVKAFIPNLGVCASSTPGSSGWRVQHEAAGLLHAFKKTSVVFSPARLVQGANRDLASKY
jgi:hypothetical protein